RVRRQTHLAAHGCLAAFQIHAGLMLGTGRSGSMSSTPIGEYALLSDCHSAALVSRAGSIDWLCVPRFDGPSVFARLLDADAGHWSIRPSAEAEVSRSYVTGTMVLTTNFTTPSGIAIMTDALAVGRNERGHELGYD